MTRSFWHGNGVWLLVLPVLIAACLAASSQRMVHSYLAHTRQFATRAQDGVAIFHDTFRATTKEQTRQTYTRDVKVTLTEVVPVDSYHKSGTTMVAAEGGRLWRINLAFEAAPDQVLSVCYARLVSDGVEYSPGAAQVTADGSFELGIGSELCVPADAPGPTTANGKDIESGDKERPRTWEQVIHISLPDGVKPDEFVLWWGYPNYISFPLSIG